MGGEWVLLFEFESILLCYLVVCELVVIGVKDVCWGECLFVLVVLIDE